MKSDSHLPEKRHPLPTMRAVPPRQPLSRYQHGLLGGAMILLLIILFVLAWSVRQWQTDVTRNPSMQTTSQPAPTVQSMSPAEAMKVMNPKALDRKSNLIVGLSKPLSRINPLYAIGPGEQDAVSLIFEPLMTVDQNNKPEPILAESYSFDADRHEMTVALSDDHTFRDGRPVNGNDVRYTYNLILSESYDGQLRGMCRAIESVETNPDDPSQVVFQLQDWVTQPDWSWFSVGILKADAYPVDLTRVFELGQNTPGPEGSGSFELSSQSAEKTVLTLRPEFSGEIKTIEFQTIDSANLYSALKQQTVDLAYSPWDARLKERIDTLPAYTWQTGQSTQAYCLVNRVSEGAEFLKTLAMQDVTIAILAGQDPSDEQLAVLAPLKSEELTCYFYRGIDEASEAQNRAAASQAVQQLVDLGIQVKAIGTDWPDLASRALQGRFDLMVMPLPADETLPINAVFLDPVLTQAALSQKDAIPGLAGANTLVAATDPIALLAHRRLSPIMLNPQTKPLSALSLGWTQQISAVSYQQPEGN